MGIYESLTRNRENIDSMAGVVQDYYRKKKEEENSKKLGGIFAPKRVASGTVDFGVGSDGKMGDGKGFEPLQFTDEPKKELTMEDLMEMGRVVRESPELGGTAKMLQEKMAEEEGQTFNLNRGESRYRRLPSGIIKLEAENPVELAPKRIKVTPQKSTILKDGKPTEVNRFYDDEGNFIREEKIGEAYEKPAKEPVDPGERDSALRNEITRLTDKANELGREIIDLNSKAKKMIKDEDFDDTQKEIYKEKKEKLESELDQTNERLERLNIKIGGTWRAGNKQDGGSQKSEVKNKNEKVTTDNDPLKIR